MDIVSQAKTIGEQFLNFYFQNPQVNKFLT